MIEIAPDRLTLLRAGYLLLIVGLGLTIWPSILDLAKSWELTHGVVVSMLGALSLLALVGLRQPLRMLPLLFWGRRGRRSGCSGSRCRHGSSTGWMPPRQTPRCSA